MKEEIIQLKDGDSIILPIAENYKDCFELIRSDRFRGTGKVISVMGLIQRICKKPFSSPLVWFRLCQHRGMLFPITFVMYYICRKKRNIDLPITTKIGYGFYIGHGMCIVINGGTIIGNNVNVSQFLNIGTNHNTPAIIADNVYIGPMVCVVEDVLISRGATIGAGAVVTKDIPADCTAVGVPAKVLHQEKREPWFFWNTKS